MSAMSDDSSSSGSNDAASVTLTLSRSPEHIQRLQKIRDSRVSERRAAALNFPDEGIPAIDALVAIQLQIDALDRAIEDERRLIPPKEARGPSAQSGAQRRN
jgi:hypothetical protein